MALRAFLVQQYVMNDQQKELMQFFKDADQNKDGMISKEELIEICTKAKTEMDTEWLLEVIDVNKDHEINYSEFLMAAFDF